MRERLAVVLEEVCARFVDYGTQERCSCMCTRDVRLAMRTKRSDCGCGEVR